MNLTRKTQRRNDRKGDALRVSLALVFILFASMASRDHETPEKTLETQEIAATTPEKRQPSHDLQAPSFLKTPHRRRKRIERLHLTVLLDSSDLIKAAERLKSGDVVAIPTETVYGLAASIDSDKGLKKIFSTKERPFFDPLIVHVASFEQAREVTREFPPLADFLARWFWPGPLTLVLPKAAHVNSVITSGLNTVAVRYPAHPLAQEMIRLTGTPLAAPSANKFGRTSPSTAEHVRQEFGDDLLIVDGGPCDVGLESTVASVSENEIRILRPGGITKEDLESALTRWSHPASVIRAESHESPGHLKHHYMPSIPLALVDEMPSAAKLSEIARVLGKPAPKNAKELDLTDDAAQAARRLYSEMRELSESGADFLFAVRSENRNGGLWAAVWDRLTRAASWTPEDQSRL